MSSKDDPDILSSLDPAYPDGYVDLLAQLLQGHAFLETSLTDLIAVEFGMKTLEAYTLVGRMDIRGRFDKLGELYKARNDTNGIKAISKFRKTLKPHIDTRNYVVHCLYMGHGLNEDGTYTVYVTSKLFNEESDSDTLMQIVMRVQVAEIKAARDAFFAAAQVISKLAASRHEQFSQQQ